MDCKWLLLTVRVRSDEIRLVGRFQLLGQDVSCLSLDEFEEECGLRRNENLSLLAPSAPSPGS